MEKLKVLWFNWRCWLNAEMGGAEVFTYEVAKRWVKAGHELCCVLWFMESKKVGYGFEWKS
ncbi:hypothetical protein KAU93_01290 [Candidatus Bathyarchaeota archaeon]|nr:hypothetical protein [Candidatus Bathyarchaeota archaeon]